MAWSSKVVTSVSGLENLCITQGGVPLSEPDGLGCPAPGFGWTVPGAPPPFQSLSICSIERVKDGHLLALGPGSQVTLNI